MQPNIMKSAMHNGLILGVIFSINFLFIAFNNLYFAFVVIIIILIATYKLTVRFRDTQSLGQISFKKAFNYIVLLFLFASIISAIVKYIYTKFIDTTFLDKLLQVQLSNFKAISSLALSDSYLIFFEKLFRPAAFALESIFENILRGAIVGLIMAAFIKKEKSLFEE